MAIGIATAVQDASTLMYHFGKQSQQANKKAPNT